MSEMPVLLLSAGHSVGDPGGTLASGPTEHEIARGIAWYTAGELADDLAAPRVVVVPEGALRDKVAFVNAQTAALRKDGGDAFALEIHCNAGPPKARGVECYYFKGNLRTRQMAKEIVKWVATTTWPSRGVKTESDAQHTRLAWLRDTICPALLVEMGFLTNETDAKVLGTPHGQSRLAARLAVGVTRAALHLYAVTNPERSADRKFDGVRSPGWSPKAWREHRAGGLAPRGVRSNAS